MHAVSPLGDGFKCWGGPKSGGGRACPGRTCLLLADTHLRIRYYRYYQMGERRGLNNWGVSARTWLGLRGIGT